MSDIKEDDSAIAQEWAIPAWLKVIMCAAAIGDLLILVRAFASSATELFGISVSTIVGIALPILVLLISVTVCFVFFPTNRFSLMCYWVLRFIREQITVMSLFGMLYLLVIRVPITSFRGGLVWITLLGLFVVSLLLRPAGIQEMPDYDAWRERSSLKKFLGVFRRTPVWIPQVAVSVIPVALVLFIIYVVLGSGLSRYGPYSLNNDEVSYWVWLRSYHDVGLRSGYNAPNELLPVLEFSRYGEQSPLYLYLYGFVIKWIAWFPILPVLVNFLLLPVSIFLLLRSLKLTVVQTVFAICAIVLTWPVLLNLPLSTHETLNQSIGVLMAIMIAKLLVDQKELSPISRVGIVLFVYFATLVRVSWGLMLVPVMFYCLSGKMAWRAILAVLLGGGLFLSAAILTSYFTPPFNDTIAQTLQDAARDGMGVFFEKIYAQVFLMFKPRQLSPNLGTLFQMAVVAGWGIVGLADFIRPKKADLHSILHSVEAFNIYNMISLGVAGLVFYAHKNFHRTFAPALLIFYLLQVKRKDYKPLMAVLLISIFLFPPLNYEFVKDDYTGGIPQSSIVQAQVEKFIAYDPEASNPWCNTLLIPLSFYDSRLMLIPSGIGISYIMIGPFETPFKSGYALFDAPTYEAYKDETRLKLLVSLPIGDLYQNQDADCSW